MREHKTEEELNDLLLAGPNPTSKWRHKKSGRIYYCLFSSIEESTLQTLVTYFQVGGVNWTRPLPEFLEKFERVDA